MYWTDKYFQMQYLVAIIVSVLVLFCVVAYVIISAFKKLVEKIKRRRK